MGSSVYDKKKYVQTFSFLFVAFKLIQMFILFLTL